MRRLIFLYVCFLVFFPVSAFADVDTALLSGINQYRVSKHISVLKEDPYTCSVATIRSIQIMDDFSHSGFYPLVKSSWVPRGTWAENLARGDDASFDVLKAWKASPTHNRNLLANLTKGCVRHIGNYWVFTGFHE